MRLLRNSLVLLAGLLLVLDVPAESPGKSARAQKGKATWKLDPALFEDQPARTDPVPPHPTYDYYHRATLGVYEQGGRFDPAGDELAREALSLSAQIWRGTNSVSEAARHDACVKALDAGCDDPTLFYYYVLSLDRTSDLSEADERALFTRAAEQLAASRHPAVRKCWAFLFAARRQPAPHGGRTVIQTDNMTLLIDAAFSLLPLVAADPDIPSRDLVDLCDEFVQTYARRYGNSEPGLARVMVILQDALPTNSPLPHILMGDHLLGQAWKARGSGFANTVTEHGWELFRKHHQEAEAAYRRAWELDNRNPRIAYRMIRIAGENGDRKDLERWFQRAMLLDPNYYAACSRKLFFLTPKWGGSEEQMLEFGRTCFETENWEGPLPFILVDTHLQLAGSPQYPSRDAYLAQSNVWSDIERVYEAYLSHTPESHFRRSQYAFQAARALRWTVALEQFETLGTNAWPRVFGGREKMDALREEAARRVAGRDVAAAPLTPDLVAAIDGGDIEALAAWLDSGGDIQAESAAGASVLELAVEAGQLKLVEWLVGRGATIQKRAPTIASPLARAISKRHVEIALYLIDQGAELGERNNDGTNTLLELAIGSRQVPIVERLLESKAIRGWKDKKRNTVLHRAARRGYPEIIKLIIARDAPIEARNSWQYTPLMVACTEHKADGVQALLESGAAVDARTTIHTTALTIAAYRGHADIIRLLLDHGADINNVYAQDGRTPLMTSVDGGHTQAATLFLERGADRTRRDKAGQTALDIARARGRADLIKLLEIEP
jgi:ankyrin repeat protein/tetratricopeptide (TPR) repeat protein